MKKYIITNPSTGEVLSVQEAVFDGNVTEGLDTQNNTYIKEVPLASDTSELLNKFFWNFNTNTLDPYPSSKPSTYHYWNGSAWVKNGIKFRKELRAKRQVRLSACDWTQMPDSPLTTEQRAAWSTYRQELRDITSNLTGSENLIEDAPWPVPPE